MPNTDAVSAKLERHVAAEAGDSAKKAVSSAYTKSFADLCVTRLVNLYICLLYTSDAADE